MKKKSKKEHPEVNDLKNICDITPKNQDTKEVCDKVNKEKPNKR